MKAFVYIADFIWEKIITSVLENCFFAAYIFNNTKLKFLFGKS